MKADQMRVHSLLKDTVTLLCKNGLNFHNVLRIEGVIGITVDDVDVFLVHLNDVFDSEGGEQTISCNGPQRTADTEVCTKSMKGLFRSSSTEQQICVQTKVEEYALDNAEPLDNSLFAVPLSSKTNDGSYFNPSASDTAGPFTNSGSLSNFSQAKIEPKYEGCDDDDDDVVFLSPEDLPVDSFSQQHYMEQTQTEGNSHKWKRDRHSVLNREFRKQNPYIRQVVTSVKNSPLHLQEYEQNDATRLSLQQEHQQFQPPGSYTLVDGELSSSLSSSRSIRAGAIDSNDSTGDVGVDQMPIDSSQQSFFGESMDDATQGNQNFATLDVQRRSCKRMLSDQSQQKVGNFHCLYTPNLVTVVYHCRASY